MNKPGWNRAAGPITVEVRAPGPDLLGPWTVLAESAETNAFMHPVALMAAAETGFSRIHVLVAFDEDVVPRRPVGFWALRERRHFPLTPAFLETLPYEYAFTSNAVIDPSRTEAVIAAFFDAIARDPRLPKSVAMRSFEADAAVYPAMLRHLETTGRRRRELLRIERPFADPSAGVKKDGSTGKKQRHDLRKLQEMGLTEVVNERAPAAIVAAFETFLALEAASWKGTQGTALLCDETDARFVRRLIADLAAHGLASVALLRVGGEDIAAQVLFYSGRNAYTWKTAYKAAYARWSPGALLIARVAEDLLSGGGIALVDSCSAEDGFMALLWKGRRTMVNALIDVGPHPAFSFPLQAALQKGEDLYREFRQRIHMAAKRLTSVRKSVTNRPDPRPPSREAGDAGLQTR